MITLQPITEDIVEDVLELTASENFVAPNSISLAEAYCGLKEALDDGGLYQKHYYAIPYAIVSDQTIVGFLMVGLEDGEDVDAGCDIYWLSRFMIDEAHQKKGYGKSAMLKLIEYLKTSPHGKAVKYFYTSVVPDNCGAAKLYESVGFAKTGDDFYGEDLMKLNF